MHLSRFLVCVWCIGGGWKKKGGTKKCAKVVYCRNQNAREQKKVYAKHWSAGI